MVNDTITFPPLAFFENPKMRQHRQLERGGSGPAYVAWKRYVDSQRSSGQDGSPEAPDPELENDSDQTPDLNPEDDSDAA